MASKARWNDPANEGQVNYLKMGMRFFAIILVWILAALIKLGVENNWFNLLGQTKASLGI